MAQGQSGKTVLVVEDDVDLLKMLRRMLSTFGTVRTASDGMEAWELVQQGVHPDLVVTDVMMPRMDGLVLSRKLKQNASTAHVPVIMLTAKNTPKDVIAGIQAGARQYVTKPFKQDELLAKVKRALGQK